MSVLVELPGVREVVLLSYVVCFGIVFGIVRDVCISVDCAVAFGVVLDVGDTWVDIKYNLGTWRTVIKGLDSKFRGSLVIC
jgi:hypothetical protein